MARARLAAALMTSLGAPGCEPRVTSIGEWLPNARGIYLEAERGELTGGYVVAADRAASEQAYLLPPPDTVAEDAPGDARARYTFEVEAEAVFTVWGRIRSPSATQNRVWIQIDEGVWHKWRISVGDIWYWDDVHDDLDYDDALSFPLEQGPHTVTLANCVGGAELDRLYVTAAGDVPPGNSTPCNPPHSIELAGVCHASCGSQNGTSCGTTACSGRAILEAYDCDVCCRDL